MPMSIYILTISLLLVLGIDGHDDQVFAAAATANAALINGPRIRIQPDVPVLTIEAQTFANKVLTCRALGDKPSMFNQLRWSGPNRSDNWEELSKRHKVRDTTRNGHSVELEFQRPTPDDSGTYYCHGTYQSSDVYNASIQVRITNPIKLENCPDRQFVVEGSVGQKITCRITGDSPSVVFSKDDMPSEQFESRYKWDNEEGLEVLGPVNKSDAGEYNIQVTSDLTGDRRTQRISVEVHSKPVIVPFDVSLGGPAVEFYGVEGEQKLLRCNVTGNPRPLVYWLDPRLRNLTTVGGYHNNWEDGTLLISKVNRVDDNGNFQCIAYNTVGQTSRNVPMVVLQRPNIVTFENKTVDENTEVTLECRSTGAPRPNFSIRRHGSNQHPYQVGDGSVVEVSETEEGGGAQVYVYRVKILAQKSHFGIHYCNGTNSAGSAERVGLLTVRHKPDLSQTPPEQYVKLSRNITVTCHIKAFPAPQVSWYADNQQILNIDTRMSTKTSPDGQTHIVTMMPPPHLQGVSQITYKCVAENAMGRAEQLIIPRYTTVPGMVNAVVFGVTPTSVKVQLSVTNDGGDRIKAYRYKAEGVTLDPFNPTFNYPVDKQNVTYLDAAPTQSNYVIRNLYPYFKYRISIQAVNDVGVGDATEFHAETYKPSEPEPPIIIKPGFAPQTSSGFPSDYQNGYVLKWSPPDSDNGDPVYKYIVRYFRVQADNPDVSLDDGEQRSIELMNERPMTAKVGPLEPNQRYKIQLQAQNKYGISLPANIVVYTPGDRPTLPDFGPQALTWLTEPSTPLLLGLLILAIILLIVIDLIFCRCFQIGVTHMLQSCCCPPKANSVISDKTYT